MIPIRTLRNVRITRSLLLLTAALVLALTLSHVQKAQAYVLMCCHWSGNHPQTCCYTFLVYYEVMISTDVNAWDAGRNAWNASSADVIIDHYDYSNYMSASSWYDSGSQEDGRAPYGGGGGIFTYMTVELNDYWTLQYSASKNQSVAAHELGHLVSLDDVTAWDGKCSDISLMYAGTHQRYDQCKVNTPRPDDTAGVNTIY